MTSNDQEITNHKSVTDNDVILNAVDALLTSAGFNKDELNIALDAIKNAKAQSLVSKKQDNKFWLEKTLIYPDIDDCFIYKRATSVSGKWYLRIYDYKNNKPVVRSLKTTDKNKAIATARVMYMELKGKIDRNEKLQQITAAELIQKYDDTLKEKISPIPMSGGIDDFNTTLQAVSIADFINKDLKEKEKKLSNLPILISGGTNSFTGQLARQCEVKFNGITIGTHARKVISIYEKAPSLLTNEDLLKAVSKAKNLIKINLYG